MRNLTTLTCCVLVAGGAFAAPPSGKKNLPIVPVVAKAAVQKKAEAMPVLVRSASNATAAIRILVNGKPVNFEVGEPVQLNGRVLVPMREAFMALGAKVSFNDTARSIEAVRGATTVSVRPGDATALVNGEVRPLDTPAQLIDGAVVVPLRFIGDVFGARVTQNPNDYDVFVTTDALVAERLPAAPEGNSVFGVLTGVYPEAQLLTVRLAGGENVRVPLVYDTNATRRTTDTDGKITVSANGGVFDAGLLALGEQVQVELNSKYKGVLVLIDTHERHGAIKSITETATNGGHQITFTDGSMIALKPDAVVTFAGRTVPLSDIKPAEMVSVRLDDAGQGVSLAVTTPGETQPASPPVVPATP